MTKASMQKRQSHGLNLPQTSDTRDTVVTNILSSLATLDETAQLQWIQETSRQVDHERAYQRRESGTNGNSKTRYDRYDGNPKPENDKVQVPMTGVGYRERGGRNGTFGIVAAPAPSPAVPMGRPCKQGFFRRFMGIGPKVSIDNNLLISTQEPQYPVESSSSIVQLREIRENPRRPSQPNIPEDPPPNLLKKKSSNFFRRRPKSSGDGGNKHSVPFTHSEPPPPLPMIFTHFPSSLRNGPSNHPLTDLRRTLETFELSNGSAPSPGNNVPRGYSQNSPQQPYPEVRVESDLGEVFHGRESRFNSEVNQVSNLSSSATSHTSEANANTRYIGRSSQQDKAKQVMGLNGKKSLPSVRRKALREDGNITALESEFQDVLSPRKETFDGPSTEGTTRENGSIEDDRIKETARDIYNGTELLVALGDAARWLMSNNEFNTKVRTAYMELFDFVGLDILTAVRRLCAQLLLKGESQQLDRVLESLAKRWYECNPENGMKDADVVHALAYSIFLLNTDLHIVDISSSQRMTRQQFVRNTMQTILSQLPSSKRVSTEPIRSSFPKGRLTTFPSVSSPNLSHLAPPSISRSGSLLQVGQAVGMSRNPSAHSLDHGSPRVSRESARTVATAERLSWSLFDEKVGPFGGMASFGSQSAWEAQMECVLKEFYNSVKSTPLQQARSATSNESNPSLKPNGFGMHRSASVLSQSSHISDSGSTKGRNAVKGLGGRDWLGRSRSQPRLPLHPLESHVSILSDRSSMEERARSPPSSSQRHHRSTSHGRTPSSRSVDSFNHDNGTSIGFANSLAQTIIREERHSGQISFVDEEIQEHALILSGPPWAKEGVLKSKRHLDANRKKSKEKGWTESFVVIDKGQLRLFQFDSHRSPHTSQVGGGNWQQNANMVGSFLLRQTLASVLPPPGYSRTRPYVWALTLPSGSIFFFEAGTAELVQEWVESANYWAARTSKEPLKAGVSNMEWGWGDCLAMSEDDATDDGTSPAESRRSTFEAQRFPTSNGKATYGGETRVLKGDRAMIREWKLPQPSLMGSSLKEKDQLQAIESFVKHLEEDFTHHNEIRTLMLRSFSPRHPNAARALANWERKSQYLLREIVRYKTYVEVLSRALVLREKLVEKSRTGKKESPKTSDGQTPEPWFDLSASAPNSVGTGNTRDATGENDEAPTESA